MTTSVMISLLNRATNGNELLQILDTLGAEDRAPESVNEPTLNPIQF